ncbi:MAG: hypothetical protein IPL87_00330 [Candidatus Moraniibacteriota bacterium]|nr:MAG: hypothetical protein IPL87_00330 [Candidatus Moranbacteria bacterium]
MKIITITGTKGKTTITRALSAVLHRFGETTLRVDTDGYYINEKQEGTLEESKNLYGLVPTVSPGKYLLSMKRYYPDFVAILEAALGSGGKSGRGYGLHTIGIFSNVLEDHMGIGKIRTRLDIAKRKNFIFSGIDVGGYAIFNADDRLVCSQLKQIPDFRSVHLVPCGISNRFFDIENHLQNGGKAVTIVDDSIVIRAREGDQKILSVKDVSWTFNGKYRPSVENLLFIVGGLYAFFEEKIPQRALQILKEYHLNRDGGRLSLFENKDGIKVLIDFAHEKYSLSEIAKLAHKLKKSKKNKTIGILRLAPDRTDKMIFETGKFIAPSFDHLIIYDKIDGVHKMKYIGKKTNIVRNIGEVSDIFLKGALSAKRKNMVEKILLEENAVRKAIKIACPGDVIIYICNDDHKKSITYMQKYLHASRRNS